MSNTTTVKILQTIVRALEEVSGKVETFVIDGKLSRRMVKEFLEFKEGTSNVELSYKFIDMKVVKTPYTFSTESLLSLYAKLHPQPSTSTQAVNEEVS